MARASSSPPPWRLGRVLVAVVLLAAVAVKAQAPITAAPEIFPEFPLAETLEQALASNQAAGPVPSLNVTRDTYLELIADIFLHFRQYQNKNASSIQYGRIIDPYAGMEIQYSTPTFAFAGATLLEHQYFNASTHNAVLTDVSLAMTAALTALQYGQPNGEHGCAQGHCNFYTMPLMLALESLNGTVDASLFASWTNLARNIKPERSYSSWPHASGNWAIVALTGEYLRYHLGLRADMDDIIEQLRYQFNSATWTDNGEYLDHSGCSGSCSPMPYDHFPRKYITIMLAYGYAAENASWYWEFNRRGAWTSLVLQSPWGELPTGGRSSQHQWNEAVSTVTFEFWASRLKAENQTTAASLFRRAAALSVKSLQRWQRDSGELNIVKNRFDPSLRHGYEGYSYFSQYNLLPASMLATAVKLANFQIPERPALSETGGFAFQLQSLNKVISNVGGLYVESETFADAPPHDVMGLTRLHQRGTEPLISLTAGAPQQPPEANPNPYALTVGPMWTYSEQTLSYGKVQSESPSYDPERFPAKNILWSQNPDDVQDKLWLLPDDVSTGNFTIELHQMQPLYALRLRNSHNDEYNDRGARDYVLECTNNTESSWSTWAKGTLAQVAQGEPLPWETIPLPGQAAQYCRLSLSGFYGKGIALNGFALLGVQPKIGHLFFNSSFATIDYSAVTGSSWGLTTRSNDSIGYVISYSMSDSHMRAISEAYNVTAQQVTYAVSLDTAIDVTSSFLTIPIFVTEGQQNSSWSIDRAAQSITVMWPGSRTSQLGQSCMQYNVTSAQGLPVTLEARNDWILTRNGFMTSVAASSSAGVADLRLTMRPLGSSCP
ncbi:uncharacterized protein MONBRDRAFT_33248 [Monosiga brevicollis MX1]|uniref:F5/8 type C domain-containing protein n=1 Tax=Monosiga brevicollis TaxID=81824 RepID=A9V4C7_MONBE|nr:uncharacterized protein MONBRDRAFT_33248 [Monosiga brevicollis MX1]EDQ87592.1 predicted protein [Monosiga brevicollis MX1]|eukprot:XP_001747512.1 hypothetical protein [Monosiga brevicollis MX1]